MAGGVSRPTSFSAKGLDLRCLSIPPPSVPHYARNPVRRRTHFVTRYRQSAMRSSRNQAFLVLLTSVVVSPAAGQTPALPQERPALQTQGLDPYDRVHLQISPRPTESPEANDDELFRRADDDTSVPSNVCGFLTRNRKFETAGAAPGRPCRCARRSIANTKQAALSLAWQIAHVPTRETSALVAEALPAQPRPSRRYVSTPPSRHARAPQREPCAGKSSIA